MLDMHDITYMESHVCPGATILPGTTRDCTRLHVQTINIMDVTRVRHHHHHHHHHHARRPFCMMSRWQPSCTRQGHRHHETEVVTARDHTTTETCTARESRDVTETCTIRESRDVVHGTQVYFRPCTSGSCAPGCRYGKTMKSKGAEPSRAELIMVPADRSHWDQWRYQSVPRPKNRV